MGIELPSLTWSTAAGLQIDRGQELWRPDDTVEGIEIFDLVSGHRSSATDDLVRVKDRIFFTAWDPVAKHELFVLEAASIFNDGFESGDTSAWDI